MTEESPVYTQNVKNTLKNLRVSNVKQRREAARMAGELGIDKAIPKLVDLVENDKDKQVRDNAVYALGMFAAFRDAIESGDEYEQETAFEAIQHMVETGEIGKSAAITSSIVQLTQGGLGVLLALLIHANIFVASNTFQNINTNSGTTTVNATVRPILDLIAPAVDQLTHMENNALNLKPQYDIAATGQTPSFEQCQYFYNTELTDITLLDGERAAYTAMATVYDQLNNLRTILDSSHTRMTRACFDAEPIPAEEAVNSLAVITRFLDEIVPGFRMVLEQQSQPTVPAPPQEQEVLEPPVAATLTLQELRPYVGAVYNIIDEVTSDRGAATLLLQYWQNIQSGANPINVCQAEVPTIPPPYQTPADVLIPERFQRSIDVVNQGLNILRTGWATFQLKCQEGGNVLVSEAATGVTVAEGANIAFNAAKSQLESFLN